jgi:phosphate transport system substrate-binding protein
MKNARRAVAIAAVFSLISCSARMLPASTPTQDVITLHLFATDNMLPLARELVRAYEEHNPSVTIQIESGPFSQLVDRLLAGEAGFLLTGHLDAAGTPRGDLWAAPIAQDGIAIVVHPTNPVTSLTLGQIQQIFAGQLTRWSDVGGLPLEINLYSDAAGSALRAEFDSLVMGTLQMALSARVVTSSQSIVQRISRDASAIGYVPLAFVSPSVRALAIEGVLPSLAALADSSYPLRSFVYLAGLREPDGSQPLDMDYRAFIGWVQSLEGQVTVSRLAAPLLSSAQS